MCRFVEQFRNEGLEQCREGELIISVTGITQEYLDIIKNTQKPSE